jgi:hypothetical protein
VVCDTNVSQTILLLSSVFNITIHIFERAEKPAVPGRDNGIFSSPKRPDRFWDTSSLLVLGEGVKRLERAVNRCAPPSSVVKCLHGLDTDGFTLPQARGVQSMALCARQRQRAFPCDVDNHEC